MLPSLILMIMHMGFAGFGGMKIGLLGVSHREMRVAGGDSKILCRKIPFRFFVMMSGFFMLIRGIVMVVTGRMLARHADSPSLELLC